MSCSSDDQSDKECPLCMETLEIDDINFYPCKCEYQICRFCWHRLRTDENGLCPACRQPYPEDPVNFKPLSSADVQKLKDEKRLKQQAEKLRQTECRQHLSNYRVLQKNLVYVVGLSPRVADYEILKKPEYFGRFGRIQKIVVGTANATALHILNSGGGTYVPGPSHTAYLTYSKVEEALRCIQAVNNAQLDGRPIKASLGTTKYCSAFMQNKKCFKPECMYLHEIADPEISFTKEDMHQGKHTDYERRLIEAVLSRAGTAGSTKAMGNNSNAANELGGGKTAGGSWGQGEAAEREEREERAGSEETSGGRSCSGTEEDASSESSADSGVGSQEIATAKSSGGGSNGQLQHKVNRMASYDNGTNKENEMIVHEIVSEKDSGGTERKDRREDSGEGNSAGAAVELNSESAAIVKDTLDDYSNGRVPAPTPVVEAPAPLTNWQTLLGLIPQTPAPTTSALSSSTNSACLSTHSVPAPSSLQTITLPLASSSADAIDYLTAADDELGFDPFSESSKGLAMLLEEEEQSKQHNTTNSAVSSNWLPSMSSDSASSLRELWGRGPIFTPTPPSSVPSNSTTNSSHHLQSPYEMYGLSSAHANSSHTMRNAYENGTGHGYGSYGSSMNTMAGAGATAPPPGLSAIQRNTSLLQQHQHREQGSSMNEWQQSFKSMFPTVNIRFMSELEQPATSTPSAVTTHSGWATNDFLSHNTLPSPSSAAPSSLFHSFSFPLHQTSSHVPPPPGFANIQQR